MKNKVLVLNIDTVKNKNHYQFNSMGKLGFEYVVFAYSPDSSSRGTKAYQYNIYQKPLLKRMKDVFRFVSKNRNSIHHIELYTGSGGFLFFEFVIGKLSGIPICVVERGSPLKDLDSHYGRFGRFVRKLIFKRADYVWIRELWMKESLHKIGRDDFFFLANCVEKTDQYSNNAEKEVEFLWCNSLKKWRNSNWFIDALHDEALSNKQSVLIGFLENNKTVESQQNYIVENKPDNLEIHPFMDPKEYFLKSRFFVLPADIVFLNFALLEAMSYGIVPIVSDVQGAGDIVTNGLDGLVVAHNKESLERAMLEASQMSNEKYERFSKNARRKVIRKFSIENWAIRLNEFYKEIES